MYSFYIQIFFHFLLENRNIKPEIFTLVSLEGHTIENDA